MKNLLLFSAFLLTSVGVLAQLSVKPTSTGTDSYIYVSDQVLFVTGDVTLTKNPTATTEASIYLRNDGQLIQGTGNDNTGNGYLSVRQTAPDSNRTSYNFWCSPVGNPTLDPTNGLQGNTNFGIRSVYGPTTELEAYVVETTPLPDGSVGPPITVSSRWLYTHPTPGTEAEGDYIRMNNNNIAEPGFGYLMKGVSNVNQPQTYEYRGRPNSGTFDIPVAGPQPLGDPRITLSGNPYPSALDLSAVFNDPANNDLDSFHFYDEDRNVLSHNYSGKSFGYGVWSPAGADPTNNLPGNYVRATFYIWNAAGQHGGSTGIGTDANYHRYAPVGQGIMFVGNGAPLTDGIVHIRNSHRVFKRQGASELSVFQRPESNSSEEVSNDTSGKASIPSAAQITVEDNRIAQTRMYVVFDGALTRDLLLVFSDQATDGYDRGFDAMSPLGMKSDAFFPVYTMTDTDLRPYAINAVKYDYGKKIPLTIKVDKQMKVEVRVVDEVKKPYENAYLFDSENYIFQRLTGSTGGAGLFLAPGEYTDRFYIVFRSPDQAREDSEGTVATKKILDNVSFFQNNPAGTLEVKNPEGYDIKAASVFDMGGKLVLSESNIGDSRNFSFNTSNLSDGVYLVKLLTSDNVSIDYKTIVHNK